MDSWCSNETENAHDELKLFRYNPEKMCEEEATSVSLQLRQNILTVSLVSDQPPPPPPLQGRIRGISRYAD